MRSFPSSIWLVLVFLHQTIGLKNVTVSVIDPSVQFGGHDWWRDDCGSHTCVVDSSVFLSFTGQAIYLQSIPSLIEGNGIVLSIQVDTGERLPVTVSTPNSGSLAGSSSLQCNSIAFAQTGLSDGPHTINVTYLQSTGAECWEFSGFLVSVPGESSPATSPPAGSTTSLPTGGSSVSPTQSSTSSVGTSSSGQGTPLWTQILGGVLSALVLIGVGIGYMSYMKRKHRQRHAPSAGFDVPMYKPSSLSHSYPGTPSSSSPMLPSLPTQPDPQGQVPPAIYIVNSPNIVTSGRDIINTRNDQHTHNTDSFNNTHTNHTNSHNTGHW